MSKKQKRMIIRALRRNGRIFPCATRANLRECFSCFEDSLIFWYNTQDGSTHVEIQKA
jgi:hypothetical protein